MSTKFDILRMLHIADSAFPSGSFAFSQGLEACVLMHQDTALSGSVFALENWIESQLRHRWACCERVILRQGYLCEGDLKQIMALDALVEANSCVEALRSGSRRQGRALLTSYHHIGVSAATHYLDLVKAKQTHGHLPVVQAFIWWQDGIKWQEAELISAYQALMGLVSAALRLNLMGAIAAQALIRRLLVVVEEVLAQEIDESFGFCSFVPWAEIALMQPNADNQRLFSN